VYTYRYYNIEETGSKRLHTHCLGWLTAAYAEKMCDRFNYMVREYDETHPLGDQPRPRGLELVVLEDLVDPDFNRLSVKKILSTNQPSHQRFLEWFLDQHVVAQLPPVFEPDLPATTDPIVDSTPNEPRRPLWSQQLFDAAVYNQASVVPKWKVETGLFYDAVSDPTTDHGRSLKRLRECALENNNHKYVGFWQPILICNLIHVLCKVILFIFNWI
jgi:hypothetical protein